ncbi:MAG: chemotaxis protein CheW [Kofleriaceae bacterium]|nr:chemotaxis protein CheW [Kofleriaceae bacterium]
MKSNLILRTDTEQSDTDTDTRTFFIISIGEMELAFPVESVSAVLEYQRPTLVPHAPRHISGLVIYGGQRALALVEMGDLLTLEPSPKEDNGRQRIVVITDQSLEVGIVVDHAIGIKVFSAEDLGPVKALQGERIRQFMEGEIQSDSGLIGVINLPVFLEEARVPS